MTNPKLTILSQTTMVPLFLMNMNKLNSDGDRKEESNIILVEPRRVATRSAAQRMSSIQGESVGDKVGYVIRGESKFSGKKTKITVMTDGVLLNKLRDDPELSGIDYVILDEFHERNVNTDLLVTLLREVQMNFRDDLKIVVMSATLLSESNEDDFSKEESTGDKLKRVLGGIKDCKIIRSEGRQFPITYHYPSNKKGILAPFGLLLNDSRKLVSTVVETIEEGLNKAPSKGDILVFLPGKKEIIRVVQECEKRLGNDVDILPLYGALSKNEQDLAINRNKHSQRRRVIVSSPIAEASLTIEGITCVIDSGLKREPRYDTETGLPRLITVKVSQDSAIQRAGRAGRTEPGICVRLFSEKDFNKMDAHAKPEIKNTDLVPTILFLMEWGCSDANDIIHEMPFVDAPPSAGIQKAFEMLMDLNACESFTTDKSKKYRITSHGAALVKLPTHPRYASAIIKAKDEVKSNPYRYASAIIAVGLLEEEIASSSLGNTDLSEDMKYILQNGNSFVEKKIIQFASRVGGMEAQKVIQDIFSSNSIEKEKVVEEVGSALLPGFYDLIAQYKGTASYSSSLYMLSLGNTARLDSGNGEEEYILVLQTSQGDDGISRIRSYVPLELSDQILSEHGEEKDEYYAVASKGYEVRGRRVLKIGSKLEISSKPIPKPSGEIIQQVLRNTIISLGGVKNTFMSDENSGAVSPKKKNSKKKKSGDNVNDLEELRNRVRLASKSMVVPECFKALDTLSSLLSEIDSTDDKVGTKKDIQEREEEAKELLLTVVDPWLFTVGSLRDLNIYEIILSELSPDQIAYLDEYFPTSIKAPDDSFIDINYSSDIPTATAKLQQFFGFESELFIGPNNENKVPISISLQSPSGKILAQTIDLPFFWRETYPQIKKEMKGKYPKHPWPDDPLLAKPTLLSKKQLVSKGESQEEDKVTNKKGKKKKKKKR